jgi:hypothetical protein
LRPYAPKLANKLRKGDKRRFNSEGVVVHYINKKGQKRLPRPQLLNTV